MTTPQALRQEMAKAFIQQPLRSLALTAVMLGGAAYGAKSYYDWYTTPPAYDAETCLKDVNTHIIKKLPKYIKSGATITPQAMFNECLEKGPRE